MRSVGFSQLSQQMISALPAAMIPESATSHGASQLLAAVRKQARRIEQCHKEFAKEDAEIGTTIGSYQIREKLGEGGFGVVYLAAQRVPMNRKVALKILKRGMDTKQIVGRFEAERQALALLDHPNIGKVLDGGMTEDGRPYFVMELVKGLPLMDFCDRHRMAVRTRLKLFRKICRAVHHAHQRGIIHRDLKPSNILVSMQDGEPVPKLIDFGIAKATQQDLTDKTVFTRYQDIVGTPAYMSPEQATSGALAIDHRTDIYALGVLLYELLTGKTPVDPKTLVNTGAEQLRQRLRELEPSAPSTCIKTLEQSDLTKVANTRDTDPNKLHRLLRREVDWIILKALDKDRTLRYASAELFSRDIDRYLQGQAIEAKGPSVSYRVRKFVRKHRTIIGAAAIAVVAFGLGVMAGA